MLLAFQNHVQRLFTQAVPETAHGEAEAQEGPMTTVWIYVDSSKEVGDVDHLKVFATPELADEWLKENDPRASYSAMR